MKLKSRWFEQSDKVLTVALFAGALVFFAIDWQYTLSNGFHNLHAGVSTIGAERVLAGELPYRDFWTMYAPGHFYLLALIFQIFGTHLMVEVVAASVVSAAAVSVCYRFGFNIVGRRFVALVPALVFLATMYNSGYFKRLGSYPTVIFLILVALNMIVLYWKTERSHYLVGAGLVTGLAIAFKHDVAAYTAIAVVAGLIAYHFSSLRQRHNRAISLLAELAFYAASIAMVFLPILLYFAIVSRPDMVQDLVIFPLTDFRFARPEAYPSLLPFSLFSDSGLLLIQNLATYTYFTIPFALFVLGIFVTGLAAKRHKPLYVATGITFLTGFLLHYSAAHVQINTHIVTMSVYAALLGIIAYDLLREQLLAGRQYWRLALPAALVAGWLMALFAQPAYIWWAMRGSATAELTLAKVSGFRVSPDEASTLTNLVDFVENNIGEDQELFVGLHRHDVLVVGDVMIYFILNRPQLTRYHELHPAITDTSPVQQEMVENLQRKDVPYIILRQQIFPDETLERVKSNFKKNLPQIGATELDTFIRTNYVKIQEFGPYSVWERSEEDAGRSASGIIPEERAGA